MRKLFGSKVQTLLAAAAVAGLTGASARADLMGFSGFAPVNTNTPTSATIGYSSDGSSFTLTDNGGGEATSGFATTPQDVTSNLAATFTYLGNGGADGSALIFQNDSRGTTALGSAGGGLGYGGITPSAAVELNIYGGHVQGLALGTGGNINYATNSFNPGSNNPVKVNTYYDAANNVVYASMYDTVAGNGYTTKATGVNLANVVGGNTALVGFSGATGGVTSTQTVSNFNLVHNPAVSQPIAFTGYNQALIVPASNTQAAPFAGLTSTMDAGTGLTGATFYEKGYNPNAPETGLPNAGQTFLGAQDASHLFQLAPSFNANDVVQVSGAGGGPVTINLTSPLAYSTLSFLDATGNGSGDISVVVRHADGTSETFKIVSPDWFGGMNTAVSASGRVNAGGTNGAAGYDSVGSSNPRLYEQDVTLSDTASPVQSIDLSSADGTGQQVVFAVSGLATAVPEPATAGVLLVGAVGLLARRRRN